MAKATWNGAVLAETDNPIVVEGNVYFPLESVNREHLQPSEAETTCAWKGTANYYNVVVNGDVNENAAWYYAEPLEKAAQLKDHVAFWNGVEVEQ